MLHDQTGTVALAYRRCLARLNGMFARAMSSRSSQAPLRRAGRVAAAAILAAGALTAAGCGGGERQDADEPEGEYRLEVVEAKFPARQSLAGASTLRIGVRNLDKKTAPNIAVTVETKAPTPGGSAVAFGQNQEDSSLADSGRPVWIVDSEPRGGTSAYTNTWALGPLLPGQTKTFEWRVTPVQAGRYTVSYRVSPGLDGRARLEAASRSRGAFRVTVADDPVPARVDDDGDVVRGEQAGAGADN